MKKKIFILLTIIILLTATITTLLYLNNKKIINNIKNSYNEYITINKDTNIYNEKQDIIGTIKKDTYLELEYNKVNSKKDIYFKIKNSDYYVLYKDITKSEKKEKNINIKDYYVNLGINITTENTTNLYNEEKLEITINNSNSFNVIKSNENYYYIEYLNNIYQIKKDEIKETKEIETEPCSNYISILNYEKTEENCTVQNCVTINNLKKQFEKIKENGNYTITIEDYKLWHNNNINLKEKAILITSKDEKILNIAQEYNMYVETNIEALQFTDSNSKSEKNSSPIPRYNIINKTDENKFNQIINGEPVTYIEEKPPVYYHQLPDINSKANEIAVLNYHFFFDPEAGETCPDGNCISVQNFEQQLNYLKQNNYKTLTMDEFKKWMYGEIDLPARSVLITIDDGAMGTGKHNGNKLIPLLEKYQMHATLFLITGWWSIDNYRSPNLDIESHTYNMHEGNYCDGVSRGSKLLCSTKEQVLEDLKLSIEITGSKNAFCYPLYVYNETTLQVLKELDFKLAFIGGDYKATRNIDKLKIPRYHIYRQTTLDQFINMIN